MNWKKSLPIFIIALMFVFWSAIFIYNVSFIAIDGRYYVNLFDDAMISARYAWNLAQGYGLVWNPGEYVEGYTNLLMTLFMSMIMAITNDKRLSLFIVHLSGVVIMLAIAYATMRVADHISANETEWHQKWLRALTFACVLFYYPLAYWTLMGMETGLLTLLLVLSVLSALKYARRPTPFPLFFTALFLGLAYLTRPDAVIAAILIFLFIFYETYQYSKPDRPSIAILLAAIAVYALFIVGMQIFRTSYYGETLPNTYYLKATGWPLITRIRNGILFVIPFVQTTLLALVLMVASLLLGPKTQQIRRQKLLLIILAIAYIYYQIWIGGDAFPPYWRIMVPTIPLVLVLSIQGIIYLLQKIFNLRFFKEHPKSTKYLGPTVLVVTIIVLAITNVGFWPEVALLSRPYEAKSNEYHVNTAIALNTLTAPAATIGVTSAGTVPYFTDNRWAIDYLGKSDKQIARLPADVSGHAKFNGLISLPGHNKYDLNYSIKELKPTYTQVAGWGGQVLDDWVEEHYTTVNYKGVNLYLLNNSPDVLWDKIEEQQ